MNEEKKRRGFQPKQPAEDPTVFSIYRESLLVDETLSDRANKLLESLKIKYKNTVFYTEATFEGINIRLKQNSVGGIVIEITRATLESVTAFITKIDKHITCPEEIPEIPLVVAPQVMVRRKVM